MTTRKSNWPEMAKEGFWGLSGKIVDAISPHSEADPVALLSQLLVAFGNVIGSSAHFTAEADKHAGNLFIINVGNSAKGRKGSSWGHIERLFKAADSNWANNCIKTGLASGEGLLWAIRDQDESLDLPEAFKSSSDKRLLSVESEFASILKVIKREGNTLSPMLRNAWDGKTLHTLTKNNPIKVSDPHLSVIGHITKTELLNLLDQNEVSNGLLNRFLFFCVARSKLLPEGGSINEVDFSMMVEELKASIEFAINQTKIERDHLTRTMWANKYNLLAQSKPGVVGTLSARSEAQVMRLSLILSLLNRKDHIDIDCMKAAFAIHEYCEQSLYYLFGKQLGNSLADFILEHLDSSPMGLTKGDIYKITNRNASKASIANALNILEDSTFAVLIEQKRSGKPESLWLSSKYIDSVKTYELYESYEDSEVVNSSNSLNSYVSGENTHGII